MMNRKIMASFLLAAMASISAISPALARDNGANAFAMQMYQQTLLNQQAQAAAAQQQQWASQMQYQAAQDAWAASMGLRPNGAGGYVYPDGAPYIPGVGRPENAYNYGYGIYSSPYRHHHWHR